MWFQDRVLTENEVVSSVVPDRSQPGAAAYASGAGSERAGPGEGQR